MPLSPEFWKMCDEAGREPTLRHEDHIAAAENRERLYGMLVLAVLSAVAIGGWILWEVVDNYAPVRILGEPTFLEEEYVR